MKSPTIPPAGSRPRPSIAAIMGVVALAALACKWPMQAIPIATFAAVGGAIRLIRPGRVRAYGLVLAATYAPALIGHSLDCTHCRETWAVIWPVIPGGIVAEFARSFEGLPRLSDAASYALAAAITLALILMATAIAPRGRMALATVLAAWTISCAWAFFIAAALLRA